MERRTRGIFSVNLLYTLLQGFQEQSGWQGVDITLSGVNSGSSGISDTFLLTAGTDYRSTNSGASPDAICTDANPGCSSGNSANVPSEAGSESQTIASGTTGTALVYNDAFLTSASGNGYWLDVQELELPNSGTNSFVGGYLDTVTITNISGSGSTTEQLDLAGLTVNSTAVATPEPAPFFLLSTGLGALLIARFRRRKQEQVA